ncbi:MAG: hypothetical protein ACI8PT_001004 [Gammaproteobacteria bacterium]|jgi:hypothetical protein
MDIQKLTAFFLWCSIIDGALLILWVVVFMMAPDLVYRMQSTFFPIPRESFDVVMYSSLGLFKIFWLVLNVVPYVALRIAGRK